MQISGFQAANITVMGNTVRGNQYGVYISQHIRGVSVLGNVATGNGDSGASVGAGMIYQWPARR